MCNTELNNLLKSSEGLQIKHTGAHLFCSCRVTPTSNAPLEGPASMCDDVKKHYAGIQEKIFLVEV